MATIPIPMNKTANRLMQWPLAEVLKNKGIQVQRFAWNPQQTTTFTGNEGTKITIPANALGNTNTISSSDTITLELIEVYEKSSMLFAGRTSTSEDHILHNCGQLFIQLRYKDKSLPLRQAIKVQLREEILIKDALVEQLYRSGTKVTRPFSGQAGQEWKRSEEPTLKVALGRNKASIHFQTTLLGWMQCAAPVPPQAKQVMISARYKCDAGPLDEKVAFILFDKYNAIAPMYPQNRHFSAFNLPAGEQASILILGRRKSMYFLGIHQLERTTNTSVEINLQRHSILQFFTNLKQL